MVDEITSGDILTVLTPIWTTKPETASRVRQRIETVLDWAVAQGYRTDNPAGRAIAKVLPRLSRVKEHRAALPYGDVAAALQQVRESAANPATKLSLEFLVLTAARSGEVRLASWEEIDEEAATWTIPAARMKARRPHRVPLSGRALDVLEEARGLEQGGGLVSPVAGLGSHCQTWSIHLCSGGWAYPQFPTASAAPSRTGALSAPTLRGRLGRLPWPTPWATAPRQPMPEATSSRDAGC